MGRGSRIIFISRCIKVISVVSQPHTPFIVKQRLHLFSIAELLAATLLGVTQQPVQSEHHRSIVIRRQSTVGSEATALALALDNNLGLLDANWAAGARDLAKHQLQYNGFTKHALHWLFADLEAALLLQTAALVHARASNDLSKVSGNQIVAANARIKNKGVAVIGKHCW
jgi:hypothetical protein